MSTEDHDRAEKIRRLWQMTAVPVEDAAERCRRRMQVVPSLASAIRRAQSRPPRRFSAAAAIAAAAILLGGSVVWSLGSSAVSSGSRAAAIDSIETSRLEAIAGTVRLAGRSGRTVARDPRPVRIGDALTTESASSARLGMGQRVAVELGERTQVALIPALGAAHRLRLDVGRIHGDVDPSPGELPKLAVQTPDAELLIKGTVFDVHVERDPGTKQTRSAVSVERGRVDVRQQGRTVAIVSAGQHWESKAVPRLTNPVDAADMASPPLGRAPASASAAANAPAGRATQDSRQKGVKFGTLGQENQLFQAAAIARNLGDDRAAISHLRALVAGFPRSPLRQEARVELMRAFARQGSTGSAAQAAHRYLAEFPNGFARDEARQLLELESP